MILGVVGHAAEKFTPLTEVQARMAIYDACKHHGATGVCSGRSPMGGVDIWAEDTAKQLGIFDETLIFAPTWNVWSGPGGFKARNMLIAEWSDHVLVVVVKKLPDGFAGMKFSACYHCRDKRSSHVKSGGCWTAIQAQKLGKTASWIIIP